MSKTAFWQIIKIGISTLLISFLLYKANPLSLVDILQRTKIFYVAMAFVVGLIGSGLNAFRLRVLLAAQGVLIPLPRILSSHLVGFFFSAFLPGSTGGDVSRAYDLVKLSGDNPRAISSVLVWRATGITTLMLISLVVSLLKFNMVRNVSLIGITLVFLMTMILVWWTIGNQALLNRLRFLYTPLIRLFHTSGLEKLMQGVYSGLVIYRKRKTTLVKDLGLAVACQVFVILTWYVVSLSLEMHVPLFYFFIFVPIIGVLKAVPISVNGLGIREGLAIFLFGLVGVEPPAALSLSLLLFGLGLVVSLMGGVVYFSRSFTMRRAES